MFFKASKESELSLSIKRLLIDMCIIYNMRVCDTPRAAVPTQAEPRLQLYCRRHTLGPDLWLVGWLEYRFVHVKCCNIALCMHDFCARALARPGKFSAFY